jgi:hypothetical protein
MRLPKRTDCLAAYLFSYRNEISVVPVNFLFRFSIDDDQVDSTVWLYSTPSDSLGPHQSKEILFIPCASNSGIYERSSHNPLYLEKANEVKFS